MLSKLQQEFFDLVLAGFETDHSEDEEFLAALEKDISGMNAAELRHNIKVWKETE